MSEQSRQDPFWTTNADRLDAQLRENFDAVALHFLRTAPPSHLGDVAGPEFSAISHNTRASIIAVLAARYQQSTRPAPVLAKDVDASPSWTSVGA